MPCPLFEPRTKVSSPRFPSARLPLVHEFDGVCHAGEQTIEPEHRFRYCNQGNAKSNCRSFPDSLAVSAIRFAIADVTSEVLTVLMIEEEAYWPKNWTSISFRIEEQVLQTDIADVCRRAQAIQFCLSYLQTNK